MAERADCEAVSPPASCTEMPEPVIERTEVVALLFTVNDIAVTLTNIEKLLGEEGNDGEEEADQG